MAEVSTKELRANKLKGLRNNVGQTSAWQNQLLELVEELSRDTLILRQKVVSHEREIEALKQERVAA
jgi:hypothetical protein